VVDDANLIQFLEVRVLYVSIMGHTTTAYRILVEKLPEKSTCKTRKERGGLTLRGS
jgi:hypothetical protein